MLSKLFYRKFLVFKTFHRKKMLPKNVLQKISFIDICYIENYCNQKILYKKIPVSEKFCLET